jgi:hypothetical protein
MQWADLRCRASFSAALPSRGGFFQQLHRAGSEPTAPRAALELLGVPNNVLPGARLLVVVAVVGAVVVVVAVFVVVVVVVGVVVGGVVHVVVVVIVVAVIVLFVCCC